MTVLEHRTDFFGQHAVIRLTGEIDYDSANRLAPILALCLDSQPKQITVDLTAITFCDCSGLAALLAAQRRAADALVALTVAGVDAPVVSRLFCVVGVNGLLGVPQRA